MKEVEDSRGRCRRGLDFMYKYVSTIRKIDRTKLPNIVESSESEGKLSDTCGSSQDSDRSQLSLELEEDKKKIMDGQTLGARSCNSDFSPTYYRHLTSLLSEL